MINPKLETIELMQSIANKQQTHTKKVFRELTVPGKWFLPGGGGGGLLGLIFAGYVQHRTHTPFPVIVYSVAKYLVNFGEM